MGEEGGFHGLVDVLNMKAYTYSGGAAKPSEGPIPADLQEAADEAREKLVDRVAEADDALLEKYLEGTELTSDEIKSALKAAIAAGSLAPVCRSARRRTGIDRLLDLLLSAPSPLDKGENAAGTDGTAEVKLATDASADGAVRSRPSTTAQAARTLTALLRQDRHRLVLVNARTGEKSAPEHPR
jgi:elongation factor G